MSALNKMLATELRIYLEDFTKRMNRNRREEDKTDITVIFYSPGEKGVAGVEVMGIASDPYICIAGLELAIKRIKHAITNGDFEAAQREG